MNTEELLAARAAHVSSSLSVLYPRDPIHVVRGSGQYLYDVEGNEYLDCMNNVPHVGHSHPVVTEAVSRQLALVNTNTRFLYEPLVEYAQRLAALLPDSLSVCLFVNSGSEANELALRMIRAHTARRDVVVQDSAYHGHTSGLIDISPYKFDGHGGSGRPEHVRVVPRPDPYRGAHRGPDCSAAYVQEVRDALGSCRPGAFFAEPLMGTGGQIVPPEGYLAAAFQATRSAGGLAVADEVQIGFGRVGTHLWAFQAQDAVPDIVTLGKPIGNSYPLGAVVTTPEIASSFANGMEYFNTFGGSPVACAAGLAVLDVIEQEGLQEHARLVGAQLLDGLRALAARHESIGEVRGRGLFLGVELVSDRDRRTPATELAGGLVDDLRRERVLVSRDGPDNNVIKIKPPLPFSAVDAERLVETIDRNLP